MRGRAVASRLQQLRRASGRRSAVQLRHADLADATDGGRATFAVEHMMYGFVLGLVLCYGPKARSPWTGRSSGANRAWPETLAEGPSQDLFRCAVCGSPF